MFLDGWRNVWTVSELRSVSSSNSNATPLRQILQPLNYSIPEHVELFSSVNITCGTTLSLQCPVRDRVILQLVVYHQSVDLGTMLLQTNNQRVFFATEPMQSQSLCNILCDERMGSCFIGTSVVHIRQLYLHFYSGSLSLNSVMAFSQDEVTDTLLSFKFASSSTDYSLTFILIKTHEESQHLSFTT
jgi:hypothetical protein